MELFKKHILFFSGISICTIALIAGLVFSVLAALDLSKKSKSFDRTERNLKRMLVASPSPVDENVIASDLNVLKLSEKLESIRKELERGLEAEASIDGVRVAAGIQQYISKFTTLAKTHESEYGPSPIEIPEDFAFGFDRFKLESKVPDDPREIAMLDKQRDILDFLISELFATHPKGILAIKRQTAKQSDDNDFDDYYGDSSIFNIGSSVTSKVEGAIDTIAFEISFSGKTNTLRGFLNRLAEFERPIVVRSINVSRPNETIKRRLNETDVDLESLTSEELEKLKEEEKRDPIVTENLSDFTLTLEYIEIVLPKTQSQEEGTI
ncbi:MAG: Amuc_1100 family pilus-like protein [Verrucomicrobia bacterium]|nr:Amuc_1100 family pilus-like protein [Verrucomicrobiota bacterium]